MIQRTEYFHGFECVLQAGEEAWQEGEGEEDDDDDKDGEDSDEGTKEDGKDSDGGDNDDGRNEDGNYSDGEDGEDDHDDDKKGEFLYLFVVVERCAEWPIASYEPELIQEQENAYVAEEHTRLCVANEK